VSNGDITDGEATGRIQVAAAAYEGWAIGDLWAEFTLLTDEAWEGGGDAPEPVAWAKREAIGLALIGRGLTAADLARGYPTGGGGMG
jgi:hypothetical protein